MGISAIDSSDDDELFPLKVSGPTSRHPMYGIIGIVQKTQGVAQYRVEQLHEEIDRHLAANEKLQQEESELSRREAEWVKSRNRCSVWATVAQYFSSASALIIGGAVCTVAPGAGILLIASGVSGLVNRILQDTRVLHGFLGWALKSEKLQKSWARRIEIGLFLFSLGTGLAGGIWAWHAGAFTATAQGIQETIKRIVATASTVVGTGAQIGKSYAEWHTTRLQAQMKDIDYEITQIRYEVDSKVRQTQEMAQMVTEINDQSKQMATSLGG